MKVTNAGRERARRVEGASHGAQGSPNFSPRGTRVHTKMGKCDQMKSMLFFVKQQASRGGCRTGE
eukprot:162402-Amphidinium_carterae.1